MCFQLQHFWQVYKITYWPTYWSCLRICLLVCDTEMWKKKVNGVCESCICMTSVGSVWNRHVDSLSWPTLGDVLQRSQTHEAKREGWCHSEKTQCANMFTYLSVDWFFEKLINFIVNLFVGFWFTLSLLGKRMGSNVFPKGGMKYKTHTRQDFISLFYFIWL